MRKPEDAAEMLKGLYERPGFLLRRCQQSNVGEFESRCEDVGITRRQYDALYILSAIKQADQDRIALMLGVDRSNVGVVLKILERKNFVERKVKSSDRRKLEVTITKEGMRAFKKAKVAAQQTIDAFLSPLNTKEQAKFIEFLQRLVEQGDASDCPPLDPSWDDAAK